MLKVTFYSYKGGVGRTLSLLNVAILLARAGFKVVAVDLDLEAPGFGFSDLTKAPTSPRKGVSDWILDIYDKQEEIPIEDMVYPILKDELGERLQLITAGTQSTDLAERVSEFYQPEYLGHPSIFQEFMAAVETTLEPDFMFFDSRTGLADISGVCTIDLPDVIVMLSGLQEQSIRGSRWMLQKITERHQLEELSILKLLVLSPFPRDEDLKRAKNLKTLGEASTELQDQRSSDEKLEEPNAWVDFLAQKSKEHPLLDRYIQAQIQLYEPILEDFLQTKQAFPRMTEEYLLHKVYFDPFVPLEGEYLATNKDSLLKRSYYRLAYALYRALPQDPPQSNPLTPPPSEEQHILLGPKNR